MQTDSHEHDDHDHRRNPAQGDRHTHHFDSSQAQYLYSDERLTKIRAPEIVSRLRPKPEQKVLDVGTGSGAFLPMLSAAVGNEGDVYGVDCSSDWLNHARKYVVETELNNVSLLRNSDRELPLRRALADRVLMVCLLHELTHPSDMLSEIARVTRPGGCLVVVDWKYQETEDGPPIEHRVDPETATQWLTKVGFDSIDLDGWTDNTYMLTAKRGGTNNE